MLVKKNRPTKTGKTIKSQLYHNYIIAKDLQKKLGIAIGVSNLDTALGQKRYKKRSKYEKEKAFEYHALPDFLPQDKEVLNNTQLEILFLLENRSRMAYGETKIYNKVISNLVGKSISTIEKTIHKLEKLKFITCYTTRYLKNGRVYSDRIIRCKRVWVDNQCKVASAKTWRYCRRPPKEIDGLYAVSGKLVDPVFIEPEWQTYENLHKLGYYNMDEPRICYDHEVQRDEWGWVESLIRLGYKRKSPPEFEWTVKPNRMRPPSHIKNARLLPNLPFTFR